MVVAATSVATVAVAASARGVVVAVPPVVAVVVPRPLKQFQDDTRS